MSHRHYGVPAAKSRPTYTGPDRDAAWSGSRGPAWGARAFAIIILAIAAVALVIWFALGG
jgi:hypothetical protein